MWYRLLLLLVTGTTLSAVTPARADDETAWQILARRKALDDGERRWTSREGQLRLTITDPQGGERVVEVVAHQRRDPGGETRTLLVVQSPAELAGTGLLTITNGTAGEQWLRRPQTGELSRITKDSRDQPLAGSDLTFRDLALLDQMPSWTEADAHATLRGEETVDSVATHAIELVPRRDDVGYRKIVMWIGRDDLVLRELHFLGDGRVPLKRIRVTAIQSQGAIPWIERLEIETPATHGRTTIDASKVVFNRKADADLFTTQALQRGERLGELP